MVPKCVDVGALKKGGAGNVYKGIAFAASPGDTGRE
jgi:hypothetical protein